MSLPGPSRTITVQPIEQPAPPEPVPDREPQRETEPVPAAPDRTPEREPVEAP